MLNVNVSSIKTDLVETVSAILMGFQSFSIKLPLLVCPPESQGGAVLLQECVEAPPTLERGPPPRPIAPTEEPPPDREAERADSETESDVDDP